MAVSGLIFNSCVVNKHFRPPHLKPAVSCSRLFFRSRVHLNPRLWITMSIGENGSSTHGIDASIKKTPHVLTVAGSDSGAGAGIQADLKTCAARGVYCSTVITAVTAQNTAGVQGVNIVPEDFVAQQLKSVLSDMDVDVVKTGMLPSIEIVKVLQQSLKEFPVRGMLTSG
ncbi:Thiamine biosynthetic bifunctional enzyme TH1, chloroplastic [Linum perenne]